MQRQLAALEAPRVKQNGTKHKRKKEKKRKKKRRRDRAGRGEKRIKTFLRKRAANKHSCVNKYMNKVINKTTMRNEKEERNISPRLSLSLSLSLSFSVSVPPSLSFSLAFFLSLYVYLNSRVFLSLSFSRFIVFLSFPFLLFSLFLYLIEKSSLGRRLRQTENGGVGASRNRLDRDHPTAEKRDAPSKKNKAEVINKRKVKEEKNKSKTRPNK